ncbi:DUF3143 domain-containing protein [Roseofilum reptotaenium CS-1145]|uniref:DUF3143 domain-containing protein n=1 Tax=Roseofilum reptotaenium AO1-A TaxID=1925591 RepID=A0A1L9QNZ3_9CYAN|nr:DUF3143 domain-containing protein [Roseofilum reptotaenium]MDB9517403.1 DUF3143 domain-containing protein [Roseofilum reptotaenium CS-1145]OJJ24391.1 hypothetical protein BI308_17045 [Roseofilum reptotaenium AO1-A]
MSLPTSDTPLYNHPLPQIEQWLSQLGGQQDREELHCWRLKHDSWIAQIYLETEQLIVCYLNAASDGSNIQRAFKYSLSRQDIQDAVLDGP